ncbi:MAG: hypothetical protein Fur0037_19670 [Planctomycetota bacterium]
MRALSLVLAAALSVTASAQVRPGIFGYLVQGQNGTAGEFCHVFDCTVRPHAATAGETLRLTINAPLHAPFAIGISARATSCLPLPFAANMLVLDPPIATLAAGLVSQPSPILACWGGTVSVPLPIPRGLPPGLWFATQAICLMQTTTGYQPAFSIAVGTTIR